MRLEAWSLPDDFPILAELTLPVPISGASYNDYGFELETTRSDDQGGAYHIEPVIKSHADMAQLHQRPIELHLAQAAEELACARELFDGILAVRQHAVEWWRYGLTRVLIHMRGLGNLMLDLYDQPDLIKDLMAFLRDDFQNELDLLARQNGFSLNNHPDIILGSGGLAYNSTLPEAGNGARAGAEQCWCWGEAQEAVSISPAMFEEFILAYQLPLLKQFGLVDYGCCEALDERIDILIETIPKLRWLSISPWADKAVCHEKIQGNYVYVYKPHPATICAPTASWDRAEQELKELLAVRGQAPTHIVMKDTSTFQGEPARITRWAELARGMVL